MSHSHHSISKAAFGQTPAGRPVDLYTLRNAKGAEARIITYGGIVVSLSAPDRHGRFADIVLGFDDLEGYLTRNSPYFGALIGRYGNRIANGEFQLDGRKYKLAQNNGPNSLHGGLKGFDKVVWDGKAVSTPDGPALELAYTSKDGEEGFPGNLAVKAVYTLTEDNALRLDFTATTDQPTLCNLTHHSYFNLAGGGDVLNHEIMIAADRFTPVDETSIPTGELRPVKNTPFDFIRSRKIGERIGDADVQLKHGHGYDHNFVLNKPAGEPGLAARVYEPMTGRVLEAFTTEPGVQFYTGNYLNGVAGKGGAVYQSRQAFCLEPQHFPDSPNKPQFPSTVLRPGETCTSTMLYKFSVR